MKDALLLVMVVARKMGDEGCGEGSGVRFKEGG